MNKVGPWLICLLILEICVMATSSKLSHYKKIEGLSPGSVYDLGKITPEDVIRINFSWILITNFGGSPIFTFYKVVGNKVVQYPIASILFHNISQNTLIEQVKFHQSAQFYVGLRFTQEEGVTYQIDIFKNQNQLISDTGVVVSDYNAPIYRFKMPFKCKVRINIKIDASPILVIIFTKTIPVYTGNLTEFDFTFPQPGTYAIFIYPNETKQISLPINILTPYSISLSSYCDNYCGETLPLECRTIGKNSEKPTYSKGIQVLSSATDANINTNLGLPFVKVKPVTYQIKNMRKRN